MSAAGTDGACRDCVRRSWLLGKLSTRLDYRCRDESRLLELLELEDEQLIKAVAGARRKDLRRRWERYARRPANRRIGRSRRIRWAWQAQWVRRPSRI